MKNLLWALLFIPSLSFGVTVSTTTVWEIRPAGTAGNLNGCAFDSMATGIGTDYSVQNSFQSSGTVLSSLDGLGPSSCTVTAVAYDFTGVNWVGNGLHVTAGTSWVSTSSGSWHVIIATAATGLVINGPCGTANTLTLGTFYIGGACSMASTLDDDLLENFGPGNKVWVASGTYALGEAVAITIGNGSNTNPLRFEGYATTRADTPAVGNQPSWTTQTMSFGTAVSFRNMTFTGSNATVVSAGTNDQFVNCKFFNNSTTSGRAPLTMAAGVLVERCELISYRGNGATSGSAVAMSFIYNYIHDSDIGINLTGAGTFIIIGNIIANTVTQAINMNSTTLTLPEIRSNTFYGAEDKSGEGINFGSGAALQKIVNNTFSGFTTAIDNQASIHSIYEANNNFFNNTTTLNNGTVSTLDTAVDPQFNVRQLIVTGSTTSNSGNTLTDAEGLFLTNGVTAGRDFCRITAGATSGIYGISSVDSDSQITLDLAPGNNSNTTAKITIGRNFMPGANLFGTAYPGLFAVGYSTGYPSIGAVQNKKATVATVQ